MKSSFIAYEHGDIIFFDTLEAMGGLRGRLLILPYLHEKLYTKQKYPICIDCLNEIGQLPDDVLQYYIFPTTRPLEMLFIKSKL
jgi:hypothetical protein